MPSQTVADVMTKDPVTLSADTSLVEAARAMRDRDVGAVIVLKGDGRDLCGMVTDRDIAMRAVAEGRDPSEAKLDDVCSHEVISVRPDDSVEAAIRLMREHAVRRLPVVDENGGPVGVVSLGDLAVERDPRSALGEISAAEPNR
jgi:CBS domain-containing protein